MQHGRQLQAKSEQSDLTSKQIKTLAQLMKDIDNG
jgi:hypothetical protein